MEPEYDADDISLSEQSLTASPRHIGHYDDISISDMSNGDDGDVLPLDSPAVATSSLENEAEDPGESAFQRLPPHLIEHILYLVDSNTFASLILLNNTWREAAEIPLLYAHHLSRCPSYSLTKNIIPGPFTAEDLPNLRNRFALEAKRSLFNVFLRPRQTLVKLISTSTSSSAAFPRGEAFRFSFSPGGRILLALSSARIFVVDVSTDFVQVKRELRPLRRPLSAAVLDDGSLLAVLSHKHQANLYRLDGPTVDHVRTLSFDNAPRTIALSPEGTVLAAAYDGGIEVYSLASRALSTDRRAVRCDAVDFLTFSEDSTMLLGTVANVQDPSLVVINAPFYGENGADVNPMEVQSRMWTTQILFPSSSRHCSHATLLSAHHEGDGTWIFTYDRTLGCFRIVQTENVQKGITYFLGPNVFSRHSPSIPTGMPTTDSHGNLAATMFSGNGVWLHGIPGRVDQAQNSSHVNGFESASIHAVNPDPVMPNLDELARNYVTEDEELEELPRAWRKLADGHRKLFVEGHQVLDIAGVSAIQWTNKDRWTGNVGTSERLVAVAPGGVSDSDEEENLPVDGGRIIIMDFERSTQNGEKRVITVEVGEIEPELLPEKTQNLESEVALVRKRTLRQTQDGLGSSQRVSMPRAQTSLASSGSLMPHPEARQARRSSTTSPSSLTESLTLDELHEAMDAPYDHTQPRSRTTLHRAATAVAANRQRNPRGLATGHVVYRRADGTRGELPHESDADNWEPPPPPYTSDPDEPLPEHLRMTLLPRRTEPIQRVTRPPQQPNRASTRFDSLTPSAIESALQRTRTTIERVGSLARGDRPHRGQFRQNSDPLELVDPSRNTSSQRPTHQTRRSSSGDSIGLHSAGFYDQSSTIRRRPVPHQSMGDPIHSVQEETPLPSTSRRPSTRQGPGLSQNLPESIGPTLRSPISPIPEPVALAPGASPPLLDTMTRIEPSTPLSSSPQANNPGITLSGSNLQNRLSYPVPPTPREVLEPPDRESSLPLNQEPATRSATADAPLSSPYALPQPTASQLDNLQRRYSGRELGRVKPSPISTNHSRSNSGNFTVPSPPPRAAMGAMGGAPSPSFQNMHLSPSRSISRSNSRGSDQSFSASTPNLVRPNYRRLDTIQSIASGHEVPQRSRSRSQDVVHRVSRIGGSEIALTMRDDRRIVTDPSKSRSSGKRRKGDGLAGRPDTNGRFQEFGTTTIIESDMPKKKKGLRCVVM